MALACGAIMGGCYDGEAIPEAGPLDGVPQQLEREPRSLSERVGRLPDKLVAAYIPGVDVELADIQIDVAQRALDATLGRTFEVEIDGEATNVALSKPQEQSARKHILALAPNSKMAPDVFRRFGLRVGPKTRNMTVYELYADRGRYGYSLSGPSFSVVGQELKYPGPLHAAATEYCQGMDMLGDVRSVNEYRIVKEAVCNGIGLAASSSYLGINYEEYRSDAEGFLLDEDLSSGREVTMPVLPASVYAELLPDQSSVSVY